ncbi:hypothetical protein OE88DRAFT_1664741 [Heliocybe sulcata]|uniref:Uncharacterized protein n=1 Tax=Heliocybe sulcata TaxID=5364 RepID=A0A5C3N3B0_9AGAM|nr:hypothetical protein OE88DRAFT_1664741 [Heliocybe sulcata]
MNRDDGAGPGKANEAGLWDDPWTQPEGGQGTSGEADPLEDAPDESEEPPAVEYLEEEPVATADLGPPIGISQAGDTLSPLEGGFSSFQDGGLTSTQSGPPDSGIEFLCNESDENPPAEADDVQSFVAEPTQPSEAPITWYCSGAQVTESLGEKVDSNARTHIQASLPNYAPTTWEAWVSFLSREKEAGSKGDFRRVMCYFTILKIFGQGRVQLLSDFAEHRRPIDVQEGDSMIIPAVDLPPAVFKRDYRRQKTKMKSVFIEPSMNEVHIEGKMQVLAILSYWVRQD